jgi:hypothetical protein
MRSMNTLLPLVAITLLAACGGASQHIPTTQQPDGPLLLQPVSSMTLTGVDPVEPGIPELVTLDADRGIVFVFSGSVGHIIDVPRGVVQQVITCPGDIQSALQLGDDNLYVLAGTDWLLSYDTRTGAERWRAQTESSSYAYVAPEYEMSTIYYMSPIDIVLTADQSKVILLGSTMDTNMIEVFDQTTGRLERRQEHDIRVSLEDDRELYYDLETRGLLIIDPSQDRIDVDLTLSEGDVPLEEPYYHYSSALNFNDIIWKNFVSARVDGEILSVVTWAYDSDSIDHAFQNTLSQYDLTTGERIALQHSWQPTAFNYLTRTDIDDSSLLFRLARNSEVTQDGIVLGGFLQWQPDAQGTVVPLPSLPGIERVGVVVNSVYHAYEGALYFHADSNEVEQPVYLYRFDPADGTTTSVYEAPGALFKFGYQGPYVMFSYTGGDGRTLIIDLRTGSPVLDESRWVGFTFDSSLDGRYVYLAGTNRVNRLGELIFIDTTTNALVARYTGEADVSPAFGFVAPTDRFLFYEVMANEDRVLTILGLPSGEILKRMPVVHVPYGYFDIAIPLWQVQTADGWYLLYRPDNTAMVYDILQPASAGIQGR